MLYRFVLRDIEQSDKLLTKMYMYQAFQSTNINLSVYFRHQVQWKWQYLYYFWSCNGSSRKACFMLSMVMNEEEPQSFPKVIFIKFSHFNSFTTYVTLVGYFFC